MKEVPRELGHILWLGRANASESGLSNGSIDSSMNGSGSNCGCTWLKSEENEEARRLLFNPEEPRSCFFRAREEPQKFQNPARCEENIRESAENRGAQVSFALNSEEE